MKLLFISFIWRTALCIFPGASPDDGDYRHLYPVVSLAIQLRDHSHVLPYFFGLIENLEYPKDRISVDLFVGHHIDATLEKAKWWIKGVDRLYRSTKIASDVENWREEALSNARRSGAHFIFITNGDHLLADPRILQHLIAKKKLIVSPLLFGPFSDNSSVFISEEFDARDNLESAQVNEAIEPMLFDLRQSDSSYLTFSYENLPFYSSGLSLHPLDVFRISAARMDIPMYVDNEFFYGYFFNSSLYSLEYRRQLLRYFIADLISSHGITPTVPSSIVTSSFPKPSLFGVDKIYLINLERRKERRLKMEKILKLMGMKYSIWIATDGQNLENDELARSIVPLPGYEDPYHKRPMKAGEIGCFLSHYRIWQEMVEKSLKRTIVFEDDLRFTLNSTIRLAEIIEDLDNTRIEWDIVYLGRKRLEGTQEVWVSGHRHLSTVGYSYWTLGYMLSLSGAEKLLRAEPLKKLIPVDEYIPIMFDEHPNATWKEAFPKRDLIAFSAYPFIVVPEKYLNEQGYVSDTEDSVVISDNFSTDTSIVDNPPDDVEAHVVSMVEVASKQEL